MTIQQIDLGLVHGGPGGAAFDPAGYRPPPGAGAAAKVLAFETDVISTADATIYTFEDVDIGTAAADRRIIVGIAGGTTSGGAARGVSSVTIGGVTADIIVEHQNSGTTALAIALVPTGATADIVVTWSAGQNRCHIGVWSCTGLTANTATDFDGSGADPASVTLTTAIGGFAVAVAYNHNSSATAWTNATERFDAATEGTARTSGADATTDGSGLTISANYTSSNATRAMVAASW